MRSQLWDFMVSSGLGVDDALYNNTDPSLEIFVDLAPDAAAASGFKLKPSTALVEAIGYVT